LLNFHYFLSFSPTFSVYSIKKKHTSFLCFNASLLLLMWHHLLLDIVVFVSLIIITITWQCQAIHASIQHLHY